MAGVLEGIAGLGGYVGGQNQDMAQRTGQLQQAGMLQALISKAREEQLARQFRAELQGAATPEAQAAVAAKYGSPQAIMGHADTQARIASTKEIAFQRLTQQAQLAARAATNAEQKAAVDQWYKQGVLAIQQGKAAYELPPEFAPQIAPPPAAPAPQGAMPTAPQVPPEQVIRGTAPTEAAGMAQFGSGQPRTMEIAPAPSAPPAAPTQAPAPPGKPPEYASWPRKKRDEFDAAQAKGGTVGKAPGDFTKTGKDYLESLPESDRELVRKIAGYEVDPKTLETRGGQRSRMLSMVSQFDPTYDDTQYANKRRAIAQFGSGPQGNVVRSLNVAVEHIDTLQRAADALKNGEFTPGNKAYNEVAKTFGVTPPNTFEGIRDVVSNEVLKGTIGTAGGVEDRKAFADRVKASASPEQLKELMNGWVELMGGQVKGLEQQYMGATKLKDFRERYLSKRTMDAIALAESKAKPAATGGWKITPVTQ